MLDVRDRLADGLVLTKDILDSCASTNGGLQFPVPILEAGWLLSEISIKAKVPIEVKCLPWNGYYFRGRLIRYGHEALIQYAQENNPCWARYVLAKELFHVLTGDETNYSTDMDLLINGLLNGAAAFPLDQGLAAEELALIGGLAMLIPPCESGRIVEMKSAGQSDYQIATFYKVPEKIIPLRLTKNLIQSFDNFC
jgi:hypothetical protein